MLADKRILVIFIHWFNKLTDILLRIVGGLVMRSTLYLQIA
jgi:hypothetical protein